MKHIGLARLGRDAEIRFTPSGDAVCNLSLAVNYGKRDADGNQPTQWIDASLWGRRAESLAQYLVKGSVHCFTLEELHIESYEGKNGTGHKLVARVADVELGPRASGAASGPSQHQQEKQDGYQRQPENKPKPKPSFDDLGDDIPFN